MQQHAAGFHGRAKRDGTTALRHAEPSRRFAANWRAARSAIQPPRRLVALGATTTSAPPLLKGEVPHRTLDPDQLGRLSRFLGRGGPPKEPRPALRIGLIGASQVATYALIWPARLLADVQVVGVAARDTGRAERYARTHGLPKAYPSYTALLEDPSLDAVYVGLPNGLHGQWTAAALAAGKHVLCEKPFCANEEEARRVMDIARAAGLVCREAFHNAEHPANKHVRMLLQGGALGDLLSVSARVLIPWWAFSPKDIRFNERLAGGTMMDAGCYAAHALRFFPGLEPSEVVGAEAKGLLGGCDTGMTAKVVYGGASGLVGSLEADLRSPGLLPVTTFSAEGTRGRLEFDNFVVPFFGHRITVSAQEAGSAPTTRSVSVYGSGESNYYWQLRRFASDVKALRGDDGGATARSAADVVAAMERDAVDAIANASLIEAIYRAAGLRRREPTEQWW